jgi:PAS domain S-box-containing protein
MLENQISEEYKLLFWNNILPMWVYDIETLKILAVNEAAIKSYGYSHDEFLSMTTKDIRFVEDVSLQFENSGDCRIKKKDGTIVDVEVTSHEIVFEGKKSRFVSVAGNTESKRTYKTLELADERFRTLVEQFLSGIYIIQDGRFTYVNPKFAEIFGYEQSEILNSKSVLELVAPSDRKKVSNNIQKLLSGEIQSIRFRFKGLKISGVIIDLRVHGAISEFNSKPAVIGTLIDITAHEKMENELKYRHKFKNLIAQISGNFVNLEHDEVDGSINNSLRLLGEFLAVDAGYIFLYDSNTKLFKKNFMWYPLGDTSDTVKFEYFTADLFPWGVEQILNFKNICVSTLSDFGKDPEMGKPLVTSLGIKSFIAIPLIYKNNLEGFIGFDSKKLEIKWSEDVIRLIKIVGEIIVRAIKRRIDEENLVKLSTAIEQTGDSIIITDKNGIIEFVNPGFEKLSEYSAKEVIGKTPNILKSGKHDQDYYERFWKTISQGNVFYGEFINKKKNGEIYYWEGSVTPINDKKGDKTHYISVGHDVTKKHEVEQALKQSEKKYRILHDSMTDAFVLVDMSGKIEEFNNSYRTMLGYSGEELHKLTYVDLTPEKWHSFEAKIVKEQIIKRGYSDVYEKEYVKKDGEIFPVELRTFLISDDNGQPSAMWAIVRDITERKKNETVINELKEQFSKAFHSSPYASSISGLDDGRFIDVNERFLLLVDYERQEVVGHTVAELNLWIDYSERQDVVEILAKKRSIKNLEASFRRKSGEIRTWRTSLELVEINGTKCILSMIEDITEINRAKNALRENEEKYHTLIETTETGFVIIDGEGRVLDANLEYVRLAGYETLQPILGRKVTDWTAEHHRAENTEEVRKCFEQGYVRNLEIDYVNEQGHFTPIEINATVLQTVKGKIILTLCRDITERKRAEAALKESEEKYRNLVERANNGILILQDGLIKYANPYIAKLWVGDIQELLETPFINYVLPDYLAKVTDIYKRRMAGEPVVTKYEIAIKNKSGEKREVELNAGLINYNGRPADLVIIHDITDSNAVEEKLAVSNTLLQNQIIELQNSKKAISILLEEVTSKRDENARLFDIVSKRQRQLEFLSRELIFIEERERKKFSQDLHDSLGQILTTLKINVELALGKADSSNDELQNYLNESATLCEDAMNEAKQLSYALRPSVLDDFGLNAALRMLVTQTQKRINIPVDLSLDVDDTRYDPIVETVLYRIVQEGMTNIAKHAKATKAWVQLMRRNNVLALSIIDNGIGFKNEKISETRELHFGLRNIRERVEFLGGKLYIETSIGKGTEISVEINIKG